MIQISVILITYNSAKHVIETLESIRAQSFKDFELVISDDSSTDNTCELIDDWLNSNKMYIKAYQFLKAKKNSGIVANCNQGLAVANGKWIKLIAGDDVMMENCLRDNINFVKRNQEISFLFSNVEFILEGNANSEALAELKRKQEYFFSLSSKSQYRQLHKYNFAFAPTAFIKRDILISLGGFDKRFRNIEDYPLWIKATRKGIKLFFLNQTTIRYRIHSQSIAGDGYSTILKQDMMNIFIKLLLPNVSFSNLLYLWDKYLVILSIGKKKSLLIHLFSPIYLLVLYKKWFQGLRK